MVDLKISLFWTGGQAVDEVFVCGGGAVGAACAYFLSRRGANVVMFIRTGVACAASGKSDGFLALDWCDRSSLEALATAALP